MNGQANRIALTPESYYPKGSIEELMLLRGVEENDRPLLNQWYTTRKAELSLLINLEAYRGEAPVV